MRFAHAQVQKRVFSWPSLRVSICSILCESHYIVNKMLGEPCSKTAVAGTITAHAQCARAILLQISLFSGSFITTK